jgi:hypothetical protein
VASVLGDGFTPDALGALIPDEEADHLESLLCDLSEERVIEQLPDTTYRFMHGLVQTTIYESLSRLQRQEYHRSAAEFWAEQPESDRQLLARTYHLSRGGLPLRAMELICDAANEAEQNHQLGRALDLYLHAHEIFPRDESVRAQLARLQKAQHGEA